MMFKCSIGVLPLPVSALFQYNSVIHTHNTKRSIFIHTLLVGVKLLICLSLTVVHIFGIISLKMFPQMFHTPVLKI